MQKDSTKTLVDSAKGFFSGTAISRVSGLIREVCMAVCFGTSPIVAAFWMAYRFSHLLRRIFGEGALNAAFIPHFESLRKTDPKKSARFFYDLSTAMTLLLLVICIGTEGLLGSCLLFANFSPPNQQVVRLTMLMLPSLVFISLYALNTSLLNCEKSYFLPSLAPFFLNALWIVAALFLQRRPANKALETLAMILVLGFCLQWAVTLPKVYSFLKRKLGKSWWLQTEFSGREIFKILKPFFLAIIGVTAVQVNSALDTVFARIASAEGPAYLWYAIRIQQLPLALFGLGIASALLPPLSRAAKSQNDEDYGKFLFFALRGALVFMIFMSFSLFATGKEAIGLIYGYGEFSSVAAHETGLCLMSYAAGLFPMTATLVLAAALYAKNNYKLPMLASIASIGANLVLNSLFVFYLGYSTFSVALATSISSCLNAALLAFFLRNEIRPYLKKSLIYGVQVISLCTVAFLATRFSDGLFTKSLSAGFIQKISAFFTKAVIYLIFCVPILFVWQREGGVRSKEEEIVG